VHLAEQRVLRRRSPDAYRNSAARDENAVEPQQSCRLVRKKLQPLMAEDGVEYLLVADRKGQRIPFAPIDLLLEAAPCRQHDRTLVDRDDARVRANVLPGKSSHDAGAAGDVQNMVASRQLASIEQPFRPRAEERPDQQLLVGVGKTGSSGEQAGCLRLRLR